MLDDILEDSVDQHFNSLIQTRHVQRRRDIIDDNMGSDLLDDNTENVWEPPEVLRPYYFNACHLLIHKNIRNIYLGNYRLDAYVFLTGSGSYG